MFARNWEILHLYGACDSFSYIFCQHVTHFFLIFANTWPTFGQFSYTGPRFGLALEQKGSKISSDLAKWKQNIDDERANFCGKISKFPWQNRALPRSWHVDSGSNMATDIMWPIDARVEWSQHGFPASTGSPSIYRIQGTGYVFWGSLLIYAVSSCVLRVRLVGFFSLTLGSFHLPWVLFICFEFFYILKLFWVFNTGRFPLIRTSNCQALTSNYPELLIIQMQPHALICMSKCLKSHAEYFLHVFICINEI